MVLKIDYRTAHSATLLKEEVVRKPAVSEYLMVCILFMLFSSCSEKKTSVNITQYTDAIYITGVAKLGNNVFCSTKGGLVKWDISSRKYELITTAEGLITNVLTDVVIDGEGKLWVASKEGVCQINGSKVKVFGKEEGLPSPETNDLFVDKTGKLWVGTAEGAAVFENGHFRLIDDKGGPGNNIVNKVFIDRGDNIWLTSSNGIFVKMEGSWKKMSKMSGLPGDNTIAISQSWDLSMFASTPGGIFIWDGIGWKLYPTIPVIKAATANEMISTTDRFWFFTPNGVHSLRGLEWKSYTKENGLSSDNATSGYIDSDGTVYVGTSEGLSIIKGDKIDNYIVPNRPVGSNCISITADTHNRLWLGTWETGMSLFYSGYWSIINGKEEGMLSTVRAVVFGPDSSTVFSTTTGLIVYKDKEWVTYTRDSGISGDDVRCGFFDNNNRYWAGTATGISCLSNGQWKRYRQIHGLPSEDIWSCGMDSTGALWFGTTKGIVNIKDGKVMDRTSETGLDDFDIRSILATKGKVYFGTNTGNIAVYDGSKWDVFSSRYLKTDKAILSMASDPSGAVWIGTLGDGLIRIGDGKVSKYTSADGLPSNVVRSLVFSDSLMWAACYGGGSIC